MKKTILLSFIAFTSLGAYAQGGNYVFSGSESAAFSNVDLATPAGKTWGTARTATPGYFSAVGAATYTNPSDANNVNGYVKHYADAAGQTFSFPVGTGTDLRELSISGAAAVLPATAVLATAWILGDPSTTIDPTNTGATGGLHNTNSVGNGVVLVSPVGQWDYQDLGTALTGSTITVKIPDLTAFGNANSLRLIGWNGTQWINLSTGVGPFATNNIENSLLTGTVPAVGISAIGIGKSSVDLTPSIQLGFNTFVSTGTQRRLVFTIQEVGGTATAAGVASTIFTVPIGYSLTFDSTMTSITISGGALTTVQNSDWTIISTALGGRKVTFQAKPGVSIGALQNSKIGLTVTRTTANPGALTSLVGNVVNDATQTYDSQISNNKAVKAVTAN